MDSDAEEQYAYSSDEAGGAFLSMSSILQPEDFKKESSKRGSHKKRANF
jgi:hypothetical protein